MKGLWFARYLLWNEGSVALNERSTADSRIKSLIFLLLNPQEAFPPSQVRGRNGRVYSSAEELFLSRCPDALL